MRRSEDAEAKVFFAVENLTPICESNQSSFSNGEEFKQPLNRWI